jgi:hypothetical protein
VLIGGCYRTDHISGKDRKVYRAAVSGSSGKRSLGPKFRIFENYHEKWILGKRNNCGIKIRM